MAAGELTRNFGLHSNEASIFVCTGPFILIFMSGKHTRSLVPFFRNTLYKIIDSNFKA